MDSTDRDAAGPVQDPRQPEGVSFPSISASVDAASSRETPTRTSASRTGDPADLIAELDDTMGMQQSPNGSGSQDSPPSTPVLRRADHPRPSQHGQGFSPIGDPVAQLVRKSAAVPAVTMPPEPTAPEDADALSDGNILRPRYMIPRTGFRRMVYNLTGGMWNPGVSDTEVLQNQLVSRVRNNLPGTHHVLVSSMKGGVGKTTVASCLALTMASLRGDRSVILDANPDAGTLADRLTGTGPNTIRSLVNNLPYINSFTDIAAFGRLAGNLQVLASDQDSATSEAFDADEYIAVLSILDRYYNIVTTDSGTGMTHPTMKPALEAVDTLVVVGTMTVDGANRASKTLDWLVNHGYQDLVRNCMVVINHDRTSSEVDAGRVRDHFKNRCRRLVEIPSDPHLVSGGLIELERLSRPTREAYLELAALVADGFERVPTPAERWTPLV